MVMVVLVFVGFNVFTRLVVVVMMVITYPQELHDNDNGNGFLLPEKEKRKLPVRTMEHYIGIVVATSITRCWKCPHCCCSQGIVHGAGATSQPIFRITSGTDCKSTFQSTRLSNHEIMDALPEEDGGGAVAPPGPVGFTSVSGAK